MGGTKEGHRGEMINTFWVSARVDAAFRFNRTPRDGGHATMVASKTAGSVSKKVAARSIGKETTNTPKAKKDKKVAMATQMRQKKRASSSNVDVHVLVSWRRGEGIYKENVVTR